MARIFLKQFQFYFSRLHQRARRYIAIVYALKPNRFRTRRIGNLGLVLIWAVSIAFAVPAAFTKDYVSVSGGAGHVTTLVHGCRILRNKTYTITTDVVVAVVVFSRELFINYSGCARPVILFII